MMVVDTQAATSLRYGQYAQPLRYPRMEGHTESDPPTGQAELDLAIRYP